MATIVYNNNGKGCFLRDSFRYVVSQTVLEDTSKLQGLQSCKTGIRAEGSCGRQYRGRQGGCSRNTQHLIDHSPLLLTAPISSIGSNHHNKNSNKLQEKIRIRTKIKSQVSQCRLKNVNINATHDVFLAFSMVQQIMTAVWYCDRKRKRCCHN
jgi:hypothetical protein